MTETENARRPSKKFSIISRLSFDIEAFRRMTGLNIFTAAFFMVAQMAGAGFLALPKALADTGWIGIALILIFCISCGYSATRLGLSWVMLEERYKEYKHPARQPYLEIALRSLGTIGRKAALILMMCCNIGSTTVYIILISELIVSVFPQLSICEYAVIVAVVLTPITWLGTPKDFWQAPVFAVVSTVLAVVIIVVIIVLNFAVEPVYPPPEHPNPTVSSFSLGFGAILFSYGGMSVFPTIQNDMADRSKFWKSVIISYSSVVVMYFPIALLGYLYIGDSVNSNIILSLPQGPAISVCILLQIFNLMGTFIITLSPVFQCFEEMYNIPRDFGIKRVLLRSGLVFCELVVALAFPDFGLIVNLIGGSAMACLSFILPPIMYMRLVDDQSDKSWPQRTIPFWQRCFLWEIFGLGIVGGIASTISSLYALLRPETLAKSCFIQFGPD